MLKTYLFLLFGILFLAYGVVIAQPGIKGGISASALQSSNEDYSPFLGYEADWVQHGTSNPRVGLQIGLFYTLRLSDYFNLQPEVFYSQKGYQFDQTPLYNTNYTLKVNYLELPVLLIYKLPLGWDFNLLILAGPYAALKLSSNKQISIANEEINGTVSGVNDFNYGLVFGLGAEFNAWDGQITFDLRVNLGLANVMSRQEEFISLYDDPGTVKTRSVSIMTGYRFKWNW